MTGLSFVAGYEIFGRQLELLNETVPSIDRVAVLGNPDNPNTAPLLRETEAAARGLGVQLQILEVRDPDEFDSAFAAMTREGVDALLVMVDPMFLTHRARLAELAAKHRLAAMHGVRGHAEAGDLMAYAPSLPDLFRRAATYVDKILNGVNPADLPVLPVNEN